MVEVIFFVGFYVLDFRVSRFLVGKECFLVFFRVSFGLGSWISLSSFCFRGVLGRGVR